jgi:hypothetical protein
MNGIMQYVKFGIAIFLAYVVENKGSIISIHAYNAL